MIELQKASPNQAWVLSYSVPASQGSFSWTVPSTAPTVPMGSDYKIAIWDTTNGRIVDSSDNYFSIVPAAQPTCTDSDNGKDYFTKGTTVGLYWQDTVNKYPQTYYDSCSACDANMQNCRNVSEYFCRYDGKVDNVEYTCPNGCLNGACVSTTQPSITVTSPNGGETWQVGNTYTLRWTSANITPNTPVNIDLIPEVITPSQGPDRIGSDYSNSMGWNWQIPVGLTGRYLIQVTCQSPAVCSDRSDMPFTIVTPTTTCTDSDEGSNYYTKGTVTSPNGVSRTDYCTNEPWGSYIANLIEYYCVNGSEASYGYVCPNGCSNGACI
jgi:hypothetical protein